MAKFLERVISGGQTGADQAALRAAKNCGIKTGGEAPRHYLTEDGPMPDLLKSYGLSESISNRYSLRTKSNVQAADATVIFEAVKSTGSDLTLRNCISLRRPVYVITVYLEEPPKFNWSAVGLANSLSVCRVRTLSP